MNRHPIYGRAQSDGSHPNAWASLPQFIPNRYLFALLCYDINSGCPFEFQLHIQLVCLFVYICRTDSLLALWTSWGPNVPLLYKYKDKNSYLCHCDPQAHVLRGEGTAEWWSEIGQAFSKHLESKVKSHAFFNTLNESAQIWALGKSFQGGWSWGFHSGGET